MLYDNDKVCLECGYISGSGEDDAPEHPWFRWRAIRNHLFEKEDGGNGRKMVVGSYIHAYDDWSPQG